MTAKLTPLTPTDAAARLNAGQAILVDIREPGEAERLREFLAGWGNGSGNAGIWRHRRKDGSLLWAEINTHSIELDGKRCRMVIAHDITRQRNAQEQLLLLQRAVESSMNGIVIAGQLRALIGS